MKLKRTLACMFIVAAFPLLASQSGNSFVNAVPFASVAFAGHSIPGNYYCECGSSAYCKCDDGETPLGGAHSTNSTPKNANDLFNKDASPVITSGLDIGSSAMILALVVFIGVRFLRT